MKEIILTIALITSFSICSNAQEKIKINTNESVVNWKGTYLFDFGKHNGTVQFKEGEFIKSNDKLTGGTFIIDMNTLVNTDGGYSEDLVKHLKDDDFFDVKKYPSAALVITNVKYHDPNNTKFSDNIFLRINADLTIKGITLPIQYEAEMNPENTKMTSKFKIDRTRWNVNYESKSFADKVKYSVISDAIEFEVELSF